jgi:hypothetical protein
MSATLRATLAPALAGLVLLVAGCRHGAGKYVPSSAPARQALEAALGAWKEGQRPGKLAGHSPPVEVIDSRWEAGDQLADFEIVREEEYSGSGPRWFTVRLKLARPAEEQTVRYAVLGNDPLWVYREPDYQKLSGM